MTHSSPGALTRQELYDRIRETSKDEYILSEMIRLGFWEEGEDKPKLAEDAIRRQGELERKLRELASKQRIYSNPEMALKELRKERLAESRKKREETKVRKAEEQYEKALNWYERHLNEILYLGENVSSFLNDVELNEEHLNNHQLPEISDATGLANAMGISISELRFLSYSRKTSTVNHYKRFQIPKKTGGVRTISAPMPRLKRSQYWLLENILQKINIHEVAHGFVPERSIVTNAKPHVGADIVINMDLKDFFPSINYQRIKGVFKSIGYSGQVATIMALLCSEPEMDELELDGTTYYCAKGERKLPQGAPTSPAITNILCWRLDLRIKGAIEKLGFTYTRYADDLTFSASNESAKDLQKLIWRVKSIIKDEGFELHPDKTRVMRKGNRKEVTGIVVNDKLSLDRKTLKNFRATLFQIEKDGLEGKSWGHSDNLFAAIRGYAHYIAMVDPERGQIFIEQVKRIAQKHKIELENQPSSSGISSFCFRNKSAAGEPPREPWWEPEVTDPPKPKLIQEKEDKQKKLQNQESERQRDEHRPETRVSVETDGLGQYTAIINNSQTQFENQEPESYSSESSSQRETTNDSPSFWQKGINAIVSLFKSDDNNETDFNNPQHQKTIRSFRNIRNSYKPRGITGGPEDRVYWKLYLDVISIYLEINNYQEAFKVLSEFEAKRIRVNLTPIPNDFALQEKIILALAETSRQKARDKLRYWVANSKVVTICDNIRYHPDYMDLCP